MIRLSICIATLNRAAYISETLRTILEQMTDEVELVVVDGASTDGTDLVVNEILRGQSNCHYHRLPENGGVDLDYCRTVDRAVGEFCWLMTDDDVLVPDAIRRILSALDDDFDLLILNAQTRTPNLRTVVDERLVDTTDDREYGPRDQDAMFRENASLLSFIGSVVIRRSVWSSRDRSGYYGSLFIHVGVIFQKELEGRARFLAEPLVHIRWGNAMWSSRAFEVWMFKWPSLVWSFKSISESARASVCPKEPWRNLRMLGLYRALGCFSTLEYDRFLASLGSPAFRLAALAIAKVPVFCANALASAFILLARRNARRELHDLAHGARSTAVARVVSRLIGLDSVGSERK